MVFPARIETHAVTYSLMIYGTWNENSGSRVPRTPNEKGNVEVSRKWKLHLRPIPPLLLVLLLLPQSILCYTNIIPNDSDRKLTMKET